MISLKIREKRRIKGMIKMVLSKEKEQELIEKVKRNPLSLGDIETQTEAICLEAVKQDGIALMYVQKPTDELCLVAVQRNGLALEYVKKQTPQICLEAVKEDGCALEFVEEQTEEIKLISLFGDYLYCDLDGLYDFYKENETTRTEVSLIYELLKNSREYQTPSYQETRLKLALKQIRLTDSPYHVLEQLYHH